MKMKTILIPVLFVMSFALQAQDITQQTISWTVTKTQNMMAGDFSDEQATLITYGKTKAELKGYDGSLRWSLDVVEAIGSWPNIAGDGTVTYEVRGDGGSGTLTFTRAADGTKARLLIVKDAGPAITEYHLSSFSVL